MPRKGHFSCDTIAMLAVVSGIFGLIIGSFLNVVVLRRGARTLSGRSACFACGKTIAWYDLVPVLSWILLWGRCRRCGSSISAQYPLVEAITGALFAVFGYWAAPALMLGDVRILGVLGIGFAISALLVAIATYDLHHTIIPDGWAYVFAACALLFRFLLSSGTDALPFVDSSLLMFAAGPLCALPFFALWAFSKGAWMGLGDAKLALGIGWLLGLWDGFIAIMFAFILGSFILVPLLFITHIPGLTKVRTGLTMKSEVPFGPFLIASCFIFLFLGLFGISVPFIE
jgi:leader peptidase (prepilin peptidase)/N-methyltransferase